MLKLLSQVFGPLKKGFAYDTPLTGLPVCDVFLNPAAASATAVHAAVTLTAASQNVTTAITNPDFARAVTVKGNASGIAGNVTIYGKDIHGFVISETIALNGSTEVIGNVPFASVSKIVLPAKTNASGDTVSIGVSAKIALSRPFSASGSITLVEADGTAEALSASSATYGTVTFTTAPNGTHDYKVYYKASVL